MKKIIFLVLFLKSFVFAVPSYTVPIVTYTHVYDSFVSGTCSVDVPGHYETSLLKNLWGDTECYQRADSYFTYLSYDTLRDYECSSNGDGTYTVAKSDKSVSGTCNYGCNLTDSICQDRLGDLNATVSFDDCTCVLPPPPPPDDLDDDSDGIPNKCDPNYVDYLTMDCDGDGISNNSDNDIDGDGLLNVNDPNPYSDGSSSGTSDTPCPATSYNLTPVKDQASCSMDNSLFFPVPDGETNYVKFVYWDECRQSCMASVGTCPYGQVIQDGICKSVVPDEDDCLGISNCQIDSWGVSPNLSCFKKCYCSTTLDPNPQTPYFSQEVSCSENYDDQAKVNDLELSSDVNKTLPTDLLKDSNATYDLDVSASMKVALDSYAGAKEATQLDLLSESKIQTLQLVGANSKLSDISTSLEQFSAVSTSNQGAINNTLKGIDTGIDIGNSHLGSIDDKMTTNNSLLEDIKDVLIGDSNSTGGGDSSGDDYTDSAEEAAAKASISGTLDSVYAGLNQFVQDNTNMINKIQDGFSHQNSSMSTGTQPIFCATVFNRQICINLCDSFGQFSSIFYYIFYVVFMFASLKLYFSAFKMR
ncbi:hypothetical protein [Sulfurimonas sp.]|jgi:hypothetical protein|uniref:hypothetical protein n=1 Tax=Sulfurimonas sp. TaxID=2022749 RepID=UPI002A35DF0C|nr:hypothetical protein [Sulfurimonas sp.]MDY0123869.1 hypothetical protein [Sulfurimonas sp.]